MENKNDFDFEMFEGKGRKKETPEQNEQKKAEKKNRQKAVNAAVFGTLAVIIIIIAVLAAPFFFAKYNAERTAKQYIEAVIGADYGSIYDKSDCRRSYSFGREDFVAACEASPALVSLCDGEIKDYKIEKYGAPDGDSQNMLVTFTYSADGAEAAIGRYVFPIAKISNGFWKYDEYAAVMTFDIICRARIYAPRQTTVFVNGEEINEEACEIKTATAPGGGSFTYVEYSLNPILAGAYTIKAENGFCTPFEESININKLNSDIYITMPLSEDGINKLLEAASANLNTIFGGAAANSVDPASLPLTSAFAENGFDETIKALEKELFADVDYISVKDLEIKELKLTEDINSRAVLTATGENKIALPLSFEYTYKFANTDYSGEDDERSNEGFAIITYTFADGKWQIDNLALQAKF